MTDSAALKENVALSSIFASALLTLGKLAAGLASGSLALLSESAHNALDTGATILTYFAVREANKPAAHAVSTLMPSASVTSSHAGKPLLSTSFATLK